MIGKERMIDKERVKEVLKVAHETKEYYDNTETNIAIAVVLLELCDRLKDIDESLDEIRIYMGRKRLR